MSDLDLERRELCPDGACIGVIGADGRCKVCGARGSGKVSARAADEDDERDDDLDAASDGDEDVDDGDGAGDGDGEPDSEAFSTAGRELCPDGACVGVIGANGRCKVCGKRR